MRSKITNRVHRQIVTEQYMAKAILNELPNIYDLLTPFVGTKILKVNKWFTKKFEDLTVPIRVHRNDTYDRVSVEGYDSIKMYIDSFHITTEYNSVYLHMKVRAVFQETTEAYKSDDYEYYKMSIYLGPINDNRELTDLTDLTKSTSNLESVIAREWGYIEQQLKARRELQEQIKSLEDTIPYYSYR